MFEQIHDYWQFAIVLPIGYVVKMVITNNKSIQEIREEIARDGVTKEVLDKHEQRMMYHIDRFSSEVDKIDKKLDLVLRIDKKVDHMLQHFDVTRRDK